MVFVENLFAKQVDLQELNGLAPSIVNNFLGHLTTVGWSFKTEVYVSTGPVYLSGQKNCFNYRIKSAHFELFWF